MSRRSPSDDGTAADAESPGLADATPSAARKTPDHAGHRRRLRERFMKGGGDALADYELLELVLFMAQPRRDMKPLAKRLIERFGSFAGAISAEPHELAEVKGAGEAVIATLKTVQAASHRLMREDVTDKPVIGNWQRLMGYCRATMGRERVEQFRILFLNRKNELIADEVQQRGTIDHTPVYPREVVKRALELEASAIIMVHNHPSGDPSPSKGDIAMTEEVREVAEKLGIALHDHVVISRSGASSFRDMGLI